jgi:hypothetical protein
MRYKRGPVGWGQAVADQERTGGVSSKGCFTVRVAMRVASSLNYCGRGSHYVSNMPLGIAMRVYLLIVGIFPAILGSILSARSDEIPNLDVRRLCRGIASQATDPLAGGEPTVTFDRCMSAEQADREELKKVWSTFSADDKKHCVAETKMGGESSYTELITCLEMALAVRSERADRSHNDATVAQHHQSLSKGRAHVHSGGKRVRSRYR